LEFFDRPNGVVNLYLWAFAICKIEMSENANFTVPKIFFENALYWAQAKKVLFEAWLLI
jgi:hypothetical protein